MRLAQPVLRRMLRTWLAAVCSLIESVAPSRRLLRPRATSSRICASRGDSPSGSCERRARAGPPRSRIRLSSVGWPMRSASVAASPSSRSAPSRRRARQEPAVLERGVRVPRDGPHLAIELERALEVAHGVAVLAERGGEHPEVAVGGAVAGDHVADHHVAARERLQLGIDERRHRLVAERRARVREVDERADPQRRAQRIEPVCERRAPAPGAPRPPSPARPAARPGSAARRRRASGRRRGSARPARAPPAGRARAAR